jgi:alpha-beta hydrolase superfamily lysophospholipase
MKRLVVIVFVFVLLVAVVVTCSTNQPADPSVVKFQEHLAQLQREVTPLDCSHRLQTSPRSPAFRAYREYYDLVFEDTEHILGTFRSGNFVLAAQIFRPHMPRGTVFFMHGYLDHTGVLQHLIGNFLQQGFVVALYDLPGHGLSTGERASIDSFSEYTEVFEDFLARCRPHLPPPYHLISHSTGSTIAFDYLSKNGTERFDRIIFLAPLLRYVHWHLSKAAYFLGKPFPLRTVPRKIAQNSADPEYLALIRIDPLQTFRVPLKWVAALYAWNRNIQDIAMIPGTVLIVQGTRDKVVDWKYNIPFLEQKIETVTVAWLEGLGHQLVNARPTIRAEVFKLMNAYLEDGKN